MKFYITTENLYIVSFFIFIFHLCRSAVLTKNNFPSKILLIFNYASQRYTHNSTSIEKKTKPINVFHLYLEK